MSKTDVLSIFASVSQVAQPISTPNNNKVKLNEVADLCLRLVEAFSS
jgi:hypothetical protein